MDATYTIPAELVHTAIYGICGTLVAVCCYMVIWALHDAKWKTHVISKLSVLEKANADDDRYRVEHDKLVTRVEALDNWRREHVNKHTCD